jgi:uncharacterized protein
VAGWESYALLVLVGAVAASVNVVAGGGSFLTLPILIFLGLPPTLANATNRVGVLVQSVGAVWGFGRRGMLDWRSALWAGLPACLGAIAGTWLALVVGDAAFRRILAVLMVAVTLATLSWPGARVGAPRPRPPAWTAPAFLLVGLYGGFVQAGVGFLILAVTSAAGLDLRRGNIVKVLCVSLLTALSLAIFASQGRVVWSAGLALAVGGLVGSELGVRLALRTPERGLRVIVTAAVLLFAVRLWFE